MTDSAGSGPTAHEPSFLVVTTVHQSDDTRIREKLIRSLAPLGPVTYATRGPGPSDADGISEWVELAGGRVRRNLRAWRLLLSRRSAVAVIHDPELLPAAVVASLMRRQVVVDVHEHVPGQLRTKQWLWPPLRRPAALVAAWLLRLAERRCPITLAEPGYGMLFRRAHPVFPNYPDGLPEPAPGEGYVVYVGDVTEARGVLDLAEATTGLGAELRIVGRCDAGLADRLGAFPHVAVLGRRPHPEAMEIARRAAVGVSPLHDLDNYRHSLPTKVIEYLGIGVPVVASDLPGTREAIAGRPGVVLVTPGDVTALASAVAGALADDRLRNAAQENAAAIRRRFRWPTEDVQAFYRGLLAG
ncbi:MAG TPA: glycosyltransferase [Acidimicrobiia bacterium]